MEKFNIVNGRKYESNGEEKLAWATVGNLVRFPAKGEKPEFFALELSMFPNTKFSVFKQDEKKQENKHVVNVHEEPVGEVTDDEDIPF